MVRRALASALPGCLESSWRALGERDGEIAVVVDQAEILASASAACESYSEVQVHVRT